MIYIEFMKNFLLADSSELLAVRFILASWAQKTFDSYNLDMMYLELIKKFFLADTSELMAFTVISAFWADKRLISAF